MTDELFVKVVEVKKIQGNVLLGNMKCQTREFFSFFPMVSRWSVGGECVMSV